jgi:Holliday junction resolvase RusA-like endonuclease
MLASLWIPGRGIGKARPRFINGRVITEPKYKSWKTQAISEITKQISEPITESVRVDCKFVNFASSDSDNLTGSVLDALVESGVLSGDSGRYVVESSGRFVKTKKPKFAELPVGIWVTIEPAEIETISIPDNFVENLL